LKAQKEGGGLLLQATGYEPGNHQFSEIQLADGDAKYLLKNIRLNIQSVIDPQDPPKGPFPPVGPFMLNWPVYVYIFIGCLLLALVGPLIYRFLQKRKTKTWLRQMEVVGKQKEASTQYFFAVRKLASSKAADVPVIEKLGSLENEFMLWLAKKFQIPTLKIGPVKTLKIISGQNQNLMIETENSLKKIITEFQKIRASKAEHQKDFEQMYRICQLFVDHTEKYLNRSQDKNAV
jgi:hypothetical protein